MKPHKVSVVRASSQRSGHTCSRAVSINILRSGLVFYGSDRSADETKFYRPVVADRLETYFLMNWMIFSDLLD